MISPDKISPSNLYEFLNIRDYERGIIRIDDDIDVGCVGEWSQQLDAMVEDQVKNIIIDISSYGGDIYAALALFDKIKHIRTLGVHFTGIVSGVAASAAAMIVLQSVDNRSARPRARFLLHEARSFSGFLDQTTSNTEDKLKEMKALEELVTTILSERSGKTIEEVEETKNRKDFWMGTEEALKWGLIDEIIE